MIHESWLTLEESETHFNNNILIRNSGKLAEYMKMVTWGLLPHFSLSNCHQEIMSRSFSLKITKK